MDSKKLMIVSMKQEEGQSPQEGFANWKNGVIDYAQSFKDVSPFGKHIRKHNERNNSDATDSFVYSFEAVSF